MFFFWKNEEFNINLCKGYFIFWSIGPILIYIVRPEEKNLIEKKLISIIPGRYWWERKGWLYCKGWNTFNFTRVVTYNIIFEKYYIVNFLIAYYYYFYYNFLHCLIKCPGEWLTKLIGPSMCSIFMPRGRPLVTRQPCARSLTRNIVQLSRSVFRIAQTRSERERVQFCYYNTTLLYNIKLKFPYLFKVSLLQLSLIVVELWILWESVVQSGC